MHRADAGVCTSHARSGRGSTGQTVGIVVSHGSTGGPGTRLRVISCVSENVARRARAAAEDIDVIRVGPWAAFCARVAGRGCDVGLFELGHGGCGRDDGARLIAALPSVSFVMYVSPTAAGIHAILRAARAGLCYAVVAGVDDRPAAFRETLIQAAADGAASRLLEAWADRLARLPAGLDQAVRSLFATPWRFAAGRDLAAASGMSTAALYRHLAAAGFPSARRLFIAARVLRAHRQLARSPEPLARVARALGYARPRVLASHIRAASGLPAAQAWRSLPPDALEARMATWAVEPAPPARRPHHA